MLPTVGYLMQNKASSHVPQGYFHNSALIVLEEEGMSEDDFLRLPVNSRKAASIMMRTLCTWVHGIPYISDMAYLPHKHAFSDIIHDRVLNRLKIHKGTDFSAPERVDLEEMQMAELTNSADCEDDGCQICRMSAALRDLRDVTSRVVALLQATRKLYIFFLVLMAVTSADIGGTVAALKSSSQTLGAHMLAVAYPLKRVVDMISATRQDNMFATATVEFEENYRRSAPLPVLIGEGTGVLLPVSTEFPERPSLLLPRGAFLKLSYSRMDEFIMTLVEDTADANGGAGQLAVLELIDGVEPGIPGQCEKKALFVDNNVGSARLESTVSNDSLYTMTSLWLTEVLLNVFQPALKGMRHTFTWRMGECHFYRVMQAAFTTELYQMGYGVCGFACVRREATDAPWTVGFTMGDMKPGAGVELGLWPESPLKQEHERAIHFLMNDSPPQPKMYEPLKNVWEVPSGARWNGMTQTFLTEQQVMNQYVLFAALQHRTAHTGLRALLNWFRSSSRCTILGSILACPVAKCRCRAREAFEEALQKDDALHAGFAELSARSGIVDIAEWIIAAVNDARPAEYNLPITPTFFATRGQMDMSDRIKGLLNMTQSAVTMKFNNNTVNTLFVPVGLHWSAQHVTPDVGTYRLSFNYLLFV
jgi:hypothetical protein